MNDENLVLKKTLAIKIEELNPSFLNDETINKFFLLLNNLTTTKIVKFFSEEEGFISQ